MAISKVVTTTVARDIETLVPVTGTSTPSCDACVNGGCNEYNRSQKSDKFGGIHRSRLVRSSAGRHALFIVGGACYSNAALCKKINTQVVDPHWYSLGLDGPGVEAEPDEDAKPGLKSDSSYTMMVQEVNQSYTYILMNPHTTMYPIFVFIVHCSCIIHNE